MMTSHETMLYSAYEDLRTEYVDYYEYPEYPMSGASGSPLHGAPHEYVIQELGGGAIGGGYDHTPPPPHRKRPAAPKVEHLSVDTKHKLALLMAKGLNDMELDTSALAAELTYKLKHLCISQSSFARNIIGRSQGTLSDLLRKPREWSEMRSGKETYFRMRMFLELNDEEMKAVCRMSVEQAQREMGWKVDKKVEKTGERPRKLRRVFTTLQKRTLTALLEETTSPSHELQRSIGEHLHLPVDTVHNFFMNAKRRDGWAHGNAPKRGCP